MLRTVSRASVFLGRHAASVTPSMMCCVTSTMLLDIESCLASYPLQSTCRDAGPTTCRQQAYRLHPHSCPLQDSSEMALSCNWASNLQCHLDSDMWKATGTCCLRSSTCTWSHMSRRLNQMRMVPSQCGHPRSHQMPARKLLQMCWGSPTTMSVFVSLAPPAP